MFPDEIFVDIKTNVSNVYSPEVMRQEPRNGTQSETVTIGINEMFEYVSENVMDDITRDGTLCHSDTSSVFHSIEVVCKGGFGN